MKEEYLERLEKELTENGFENTEEIIAKYRKRYEFGIESNMTEEEIEERLGDPSEIVSKLMDKSNYEYVETNSDLKVNINTLNDDVTFVEGEDNEPRVHLGDIDEDNYEISVNDHEIYIKALKKKFFSLNRRRPGLITIVLPHNVSISKMALSSANGDFISKIDIDAKNFELNCVSGDCEFKKITSKNFNLHAVSGDIEIKEINTDYATISTVSGDVEIGYLLANDLKADTVSGDIEIDEASYAMNIKTTAISGSIKVDGTKYKNFTTKVKEVFKSEPKE